LKSEQQNKLKPGGKQCQRSLFTNFMPNLTAINQKYGGGFKRLAMLQSQSLATLS